MMSISELMYRTKFCKRRFNTFKDMIMHSEKHLLLALNKQNLFSIGYSFVALPIGNKQHVIHVYKVLLCRIFTILICHCQIVQFRVGFNKQYNYTNKKQHKFHVKNSKPNIRGYNDYRRFFIKVHSAILSSFPKDHLLH